jgi:hypothetical protein
MILATARAGLGPIRLPARALANIVPEKMRILRVRMIKPPKNNNSGRKS